jgi:hypothetical protein
MIGALLYYVVELPFMRLRDRWFPRSFADPSPALGGPISASAI